MQPAKRQKLSRSWNLITYLLYELDCSPSILDALIHAHSKQFLPWLCRNSNVHKLDPKGFCFPPLVYLDNGITTTSWTAVKRQLTLRVRHTILWEAQICLKYFFSSKEYTLFSTSTDQGLVVLFRQVQECVDLALIKSSQP